MTMTSQDQTYEGWSNRETWCANLWLANDERLYNLTRGMAAEAVSTEDDEASARHNLADALKDMFDEWEHGEGEDDYVPPAGIYKVLRDIGSIYRIDWYELANQWLQDAIAEQEAE